MSVEIATLYKIAVLDMLELIQVPLSVSQIADFFVDAGYTNYFSVQLTVNELADSELIIPESVSHVTYYSLSAEGIRTLNACRDDLPKAIHSDILHYVRCNRFRFRNRSGILSTYYESGDEWIVHLQVKEGSSILFEMNLTVPSKKEAVFICSHWEERCSEFYGDMMRKLLSNDKKNR